jgi:uncharacterized membrane protein YsdA (DUF1294 family)
MKTLVKPFALATLMGIVAVMAVYAVSIVLGVDFTVATLGMPIPAPAFVIFSIVGGLGAWVVSGALLKTKTPRKTGQIIGWLVLIASIATPLSGTSDLMAIIAIQATHFAIGVPLLMAMNKHLPEKN